MYSIVKHTNISKSLADYQDINKIFHGENYQSSEKYDKEPSGYVFHYLTNGLSKEKHEELDALVAELNKVYPCQIHVHTFTENEFLDFPTWRKSLLVYYRLKISHFIPDYVEKILYLDSDIIVNTDIRELFALDMKDAVLAADGQGFTERDFPSLTGQEPKKFKGNYFNSGVLLINFSEWKKQNIEEKTLDFLKHYHVYVVDQDALNVAVENPIYLNLTWNFGTYPSIEYIKTQYDNSMSYTDLGWIKRIGDDRNLKIIHYCDDKPWKSSCVRIINFIPCYEYQAFAAYWWYVAENTPVFNKELLAIKESRTYKETIAKEAKEIYILENDNLYRKIYICFKKVQKAIRPFAKKIEAPIRRKRNQIKASLKLAKKK